MSNTKRNRHLGGGTESKTSQKYASLVALGLSSLLPSFAFADDSNEALTQLLAQTPSNSNDSKVRALTSYSPVVDLRTKNTSYDQTYNGFRNQNVVFNNTTNILVNGISGGYFDNAVTFSANNGSIVTMDFDITSCGSNQIANGCGVIQGNGGKYIFDGNGTFIINANINNSTDNNTTTGFFEVLTSPVNSSDPRILDISSRMIFKASGNVGSFLNITQGSRSGTFKLNTPYLEVDMDNDGANTNTNKYFIRVASYYSGTPTIYLNANENDPSQANNSSNILKITGSILSDLNTRLYAHFTNSDSFLKGNIVLGNGSGDGSAHFTFTNGSSMTGDIDAKGSGNHSITFDGASFIGVAKNSAKSNGANTTITFKNTAGKTFGTTANGVVDSTFKGTVIGSFDVSANSATRINGGSNGSKGFLGTGTNKLTFDFKKNTSSVDSPYFTIGGGNANSLYVLNAFQTNGTTTLDLSSLDASSTTLYKKLENAGIKVAVDTQDNTTNNHLQGTLLFTNTNMQVGTGENALFATQENIVGSSNVLNGLALGAMFGNATWNDENNDGYITADEIISNNGVNYKLTDTSNTSSGNNNAHITDNTSTGNIGKNEDDIKKQVGFIFADGTYDFGGDKQGYSGTIAGGTADSKYYFANAGYLTRTQISNAKGDLVLFNTAFRGDLGVNNDNVAIMLDFSNGRNGLRAESGDANANIVGAGNKNITFNFTGNKLKDKYTGAVIGDANKTSGDSSNGGNDSDNDTAKYTMLNLVKYTANNTTIADNNGAISATSGNRGVDGRNTLTLIDALQQSGLTNFGKTLDTWNSSESSNYPNDEGHTDVSNFSTTNTTLALRGTSLNTDNISFQNYKYDLAFGSGIGEVEGVTIQDSKLYGDIDLSSNSQTGHSIILKGDSIGNTSSTITFNSTSNNASSMTFVYDDSTATRDVADKKTLKLSNLSNTNYLGSNSALNISNTNLEGNIWANNTTAINLNFTNGNTWTMSESGIYLASGSNIVINGKINALTTDGQQSTTSAPILKIYTAKNQGDIQLINTGAVLKWNLGAVSEKDYRLGKSFDLRGTSLEVTYNKNPQTGSLNGIHGKVDSGSFNLVFAKGTNLDTTKEKSSSQDADSTTTYYKITEEGSGVGNYIAESYGKFKRVNIASAFNITYIGEQSHNVDQFQNSGQGYSNNSKMTFVNASNGSGSTGGLSSGALNGTQIGNFFKDAKATATITLEGTSLTNGTSLVVGSNSSRLTFNMTFVNDGNTDSDSYVNTKYGNDLATTNANGALAESVLKVAESSLNSGITFSDANFNVLFVGDQSQTLGKNESNSTMNIFQGGSATSKVTFRDSNLNAGDSTTSSLQNIKGTIAFDLTHANEDMSISGTLSNMFGNGSGNTYNGTGHYQTQFNVSGLGETDDKLGIDNLVFVDKSQIESSKATLQSLQDNPNYFNDSDTFGNLSNNDYTMVGYLANIDAANSSSLTLANGATIALNGANQEVIFIGTNSHGFGNTASTVGAQAGEATTNNKVTTLGDSTGSILTFIDAGELKVANIQNGQGTLNLIGNTKIELQDLSASSGSSSAGSNSSVSVTSPTKTLTLYKAGIPADSSDSSASTLVASTRTDAITGAGITINAVFTGSNALAENNTTTIETYSPQGSKVTSSADSAKTGASTANIGQEGEETTYHILFDYTDSKLTFGTHHAYAGTVTGLTSDSIIKFKNAGYIEGSQIENTSATILLDNTELKADFKGDSAILDFTNGRPSIGGNIITSDARTDSNVLSRKTLTFDLTNNAKTPLNYAHAIQAGYSYTDTTASNGDTYNAKGQSTLTFQNASDMTLGEEASAGLRGATAGTNPSAFIQSLASDVGFSNIDNAITTEPTNQAQNTTGTTTIPTDVSYILKGTKLVFQGTNITASNADKSISEDTYELDLSFDQRDEGRGLTGLENALNKSKLTANSLAMGSYSDDKPLGLTLSFKDSGSLEGDNTNGLNALNVKLKDNARFNFSAVSDSGFIGTLVLSKNDIAQAGQAGAEEASQEQTRNSSSFTALNNVSTDSSLSITEGSMSFIGNFSQKDSTPADDGVDSTSRTAQTAGAINASFDGTNKIYGTLAGRGEMNVTIGEDGIFDSKTIEAYSFATPSGFGNVDVLLDASNATSGTITLSHTSGSVGVIGKTYAKSTEDSSVVAQSDFTNLNLSNYASNSDNGLTLQGAFNLGSANLNFSGDQFAVTDDLFLKVNSGSSITLKDTQIKNNTPSNLAVQDTSVQKTLSINAIGGSGNFRVNLTLTNLDPNLIVELTSTTRAATNDDWGNQGVWNIRGTNIELSTAFWSENNTNLKKFVFAKGSGTETTEVSQDGVKSTNLTLSQLTTDDKINESALSGDLSINPNNGTERHVASVGMKNGSFTFIGKQSLGVDPSKQWIDGIDGGVVTFNLYNSILKSGSILLDNTNAGSRSSKTAQDVATLRGTDTFNLSLNKAKVSSNNSTSEINQSSGANNSTIDAVFVNGGNLKASAVSTPEVSAPEQAPSVRTTDILTGNTYIDAESGANTALQTTLTQYATSNAGGALSETELKTLQSKAYGNITMENTVTATMKFIGEDSHSFDGKTIVAGSGTDAKVYGYVGNGSIADVEAGTSSVATDWTQLEIDNDGLVSFKTSDANPTDITAKYAQLIGGNANSRFDFDHTNVALDLVKFAGGSTYVYNSSVSGRIGVSATDGVGNGVSNSIQDGSSTTIIFNAQMTLPTTPAEDGAQASRGATEELSKTSQAFINNRFTNDLGINLDLSNAHTLKAENLTATQSTTVGSTGGTGGAGTGGTTVGGVDGATAITDPAPSTNKVLASTEKQTNLVFIGKGSVETGNTKLDNSGNSIDISFMPQASDSDKYSYTFIGAGEFTEEQIKANNNFGGNVTKPTDASNAEMTIFGTSKVVLVDTYVLGARNYADTGFINAKESRNQKSSWGGGEDIHQFLIFDFHKGVNNQSLNNGQANAIVNTSTQSHYIFTSIFAKDTEDSKRVLTLSSEKGLRTAINEQLKAYATLRGNGVDVIDSNVVGYLGLRGVSIQGDIDESVETQASADGADSQVTREAETTSGNRVDIVFNSTSKFSYVDSFDESGNHTYTIEDLGYNKVANINGIDNTNDYASGYAVLKATNSGGDVTIKGTASKDIVFIGKDSVEGGFNKLKIEGGDNYSHYTFYSVGELSQTFLNNVGLYKSTTTDAGTDNGIQDVKVNDKMATAGTFTFENSTITGNINVDTNTNGITSVNADTQASTPTPANKLVFKNVLYSGELSGSLEKTLAFADGSNNIKIKGGNNASSYDFSSIKEGSTINLNIDLSDSSNKYYTSSVTGFENGNLSLEGSLKLAKVRSEFSGSNNNEYTNSFAFNDSAKWTMTDNSRVMNLSVSNSGTNFNLDLASASRSNSSVVAQAEETDGESQVAPNTDLRVLEVGTLSSDGGQVLLGTQIDTNTQSNSKSDKIKASYIGGGTLYVTAQDSSITSGKFETGTDAIVLVTADDISNGGSVEGTKRSEGLSYVETVLEHQITTSSDVWTEATDENINNATSHRWVLSSLDASTNQELVDESGFIISNPYRMLMIETNNLNKRMGDLRDNDYNQGAWIRVFNGSDSGEGSKNLYTNIQLGYDYGTPAIGAKNYSGVAFSTSIVDIDGNQYSGKANTYSLALYNSYIADSGFYVDTIGKYLYTDQKLSPNGSADSSFGSHALSLGLEIGYRAYMGETNFYFETQAEAIGGVVFGVNNIDMGVIGGRDITGDLKTTLSLNTRVGIVQGYSLKTQSGFRADFRLGLSLVNESVNNDNSVVLYDGITEASTNIANDTKAVLNVGTNLILTDQWRVYIDAERSFGGKRNVDYQANIGARFSFGDITKSLPKPEKPLPLKVEEKK